MDAIKQFEHVSGAKISKKMHLQILLFLVCAEIIVGLSSLGYIQIAPISVTTLHILVIVAALYFGPWDAALIALVFSFSSMWAASFTSIEIGDLIFSPIKSGQPFESLLMAVGTRLVFAIVVGYAFRLAFSKPRKLPILWISLIAIGGTLLHSGLVYLCMLAFFNAAGTETSSNFVVDLVVNNLILLTITIAVCILFYYLPRFKGLKRFFEKVGTNNGKEKIKLNPGTLIFYLILIICSVFICWHFISRLSLYIKEKGETVTDDYITWTNALIIQFIVGLVGLFGIVFLFINWIQEYYLALTIEANNKAREAAESANKTKSAFLFNMSHDIRTPMNAIMGYTNLALKHINDMDYTKDSLEKIKSSSEHLLRLINDILEMSRIESGVLKLEDEPLDLLETINEVASIGKVLAFSNKIKFGVKLGKIKNPYIFADKVHLNEVFINIISNAIKYSKDKGEVSYTIDQISGIENGLAWYRFVISDNGIGMSEEFLSRVFDNFARENNSTVSKIEGSGLGLSIVKRIVDFANGRINIQSRVNVGTVVTVELPLKVMGEAAVTLFKKEQGKKNLDFDLSLLKGKRVLLVEDNKMNREISTDILTESGLYVDTAENGEVAVEVYKKKKSNYYDFILMDIQMPIMDGYQATKEIRKLPKGKEIPIIALSANAFKEDKAKSLKSGMNDHIAKPVDPNTLIECLSKFKR